MLQDPKSSLWLWKKHEKKKQKKRTVNYQSYMDKMRLGGGDEGFDSMGHMTKNYMHKIENFLTYGQWNLDRRQIEKLKKEEERKERVGRKTFPIYGRFLTNLFVQIIQEIIDNQVEAWSIPPKKVGQDNYLGQKSRPRQLSQTLPPKNVNDNDKSRPRQLSRTNLCPMRTILQSRHLPNLVKASGGPDESPEGHQLMTSVSVPVYKKKDHKVGFPQFFLSLFKICSLSVKLDKSVWV